MPLEMNANKSSPPAWATIRAGSLETRYARAGVGRPVLLLAAPDEELPGSDLFAALARECRVFTPLLPQADGREGTATAAWLQDLVDGLGLEGPAVVAAPPYAELARDFAINDGDRVGGLILLERERHPTTSDGSDGSDGSGGDGGDGGRRVRGQLPGGRPILLLPVSPVSSQDWGALAREIIRFIVEAALAPAP
jgi:hypothetical protein